VIHYSGANRSIDGCDPSTSSQGAIQVRVLGLLRKCRECQFEQRDKTARRIRRAVRVSLHPVYPRMR
jgi:hypothetical protein